MGPRNMLYQRRLQYLRNKTYHSSGSFFNDLHALSSENGLSDSLKIETQTFLGNENSLDSTSRKNSTEPLATYNGTLNSESSHVYQIHSKNIAQGKKYANLMNFKMLSEESKTQSCVNVEKDCENDHQRITGSISYIGEMFCRETDGKSNESLEIFQDIEKLKLKGDKSLFFLPGIVSRMCQRINELEECEGTMMT